MLTKSNNFLRQLPIQFFIGGGLFLIINGTVGSCWLNNKIFLAATDASTHWFYFIE